jgi:hypothetical protein
MPRRTWKFVLIVVVTAVAGGAVAFIPVRGLDRPPSETKVKTMDFSNLASTPPGTPLDLLFIHHSVGGQWLADPGTVEGRNSIHKTHPNGGGLRRMLQEQGYIVHEASYGSRIGEQTDLFDWPGKFRDRMDEILACDQQDTRLPDGRHNRIVLFKSCYPNNVFVGEGTPPGNPNGPARTLANAKAAYTALLEPFARHPDVLFVCLTTPPLVPQTQPLWKVAARRVLNRGAAADSPRLARALATWLTAQDGWLKDYPHQNVVVFDYYDLLTGDGRSNLSAYGSEQNTDSHPSSQGQQQATRRFVPFLNQAVARAGVGERVVTAN